MKSASISIIHKERKNDIIVSVRQSYFFKKGNDTILGHKNSSIIIKKPTKKQIEIEAKKSSKNIYVLE